MHASWLLLTLTTLSLSIIMVNSRPNEDQKSNDLLEKRYHYLAERWCANPCGTAGLCCGSWQSCITNAGQFQCSDAAPNNVQAQVGQWQLFTTTYVETELEFVTQTSTGSSLIAASTSSANQAAISSITCNLSIGEKPCSTICCAAGQKCGYPGQCVAANDQADVSSSIFVQVSTQTANANTAPLRPTSNAVSTVTSTRSATMTTAFMTPSAASTTGAAVSATSGNGGLSAGAIAGIVIGVLLGLFLFFLICAFLCCRSIIDGILVFFGFRNRRRRDVTITETEHYSHHGSRTGGRTWYGARKPARVDVVKEKKSGIGGFTAVTAGLASMAVVLGLKRRWDKRKEEERIERRSSYSYSYDSGGSYTSESSASSPPRSHRTRDNRSSRR